MKLRSNPQQRKPTGDGLGLVFYTSPEAPAQLRGGNRSRPARSLAVAGAIFLILELDQPFGGLIRISSEPMLNALHQLAK